MIIPCGSCTNSRSVLLVADRWDKTFVLFSVCSWMLTSIHVPDTKRLKMYHEVDL